MSDARKAITEAIGKIDKEWKERAAISFANTLLAALKKSGWTLVRISEDE